MAGASWSSIALLLVGLLCSASFRVGLASEDAAEKPMTERDAYEILGVDKRTLDKDIRRIFKEKSLLLHPDKEEGSEEAFKELRQAYETLIDPERRIVLDELDGKGFDHPNEVEVLGPDLELSDFYEESRQIVKFSNENILSLLWRKQAWVVQFYVPWCGHCQNMAPKWKLLTTKYASNEMIRFGAVNCMNQQSMCDRYPFQLVPTFMCFHSDKDYHLYEGIPDEERIDEFIQKCADDFEVHLENGDPVFDKFMTSGGAAGAEVDLDADEYDYDLFDEGDEGQAEVAAPARSEKKAETEAEALAAEDDSDLSDSDADDSDDEESDDDDDGTAEEEAAAAGPGGLATSRDDGDYDYELVDEDDGEGEGEVEAEAEEPITEEEVRPSPEAKDSSVADLEAENKRLKGELEMVKQRMEEHEKMIAKIKTLFT